MLGAIGQKLTKLLIGAIALTVTALADPFGSISVGKCVVDRNNLEASSCDQFTVGVGYELTDHVRVDARYNVLDSTITGLNGASDSTGTYERDEWTLGAEYTFNPNSPVQFSVGARAGQGEITTRFTGTADIDNTIQISANDTVSETLWGATAALAWQAKPNVALFAEASYMQYLDNGFDARLTTATGATGELSPGGVMGEDRSYDLRLGLRFYF